MSSSQVFILGAVPLLESMHFSVPFLCFEGDALCVQQYVGTVAQLEWGN